MKDPNKEAALIQVLAERLEKVRLPRALAIQDSVNRGEVLGDADLGFLQEVLRDAAQIAPLVNDHPEWQDLVGRLMQLYNQITAKALENEERAQGGKAAY